MELEFIDMISGDGGFADIWRARDALGRDLAVKIIREASIGISNALQHARALARAKHQNVVVVHSIEKVNDPQGGELVDAVVMEFLQGETLGQRLEGSPLSQQELQRIGQGLFGAVRHIHTQGMVHGDLHEHNIMVVDGEVKIIDLLHRYTLALVSADKRTEQVRRELRALKGLLQQVVGHSEVSAPHSYAFTEEIRGEVPIEVLEEAFHNMLADDPPSRLRLEHPRTPLNLLDLIQPEMHRDNIRGLLGSPSFVSGDRWLYRYQETQVEINFDQADAANAIMVVLCAGKKYHGAHPSVHTDQPLGDLTLADVRKRPRIPV